MAALSTKPYWPGATAGAGSGARPGASAGSGSGSGSGAGADVNGRASLGAGAPKSTLGGSEIAFSFSTVKLGLVLCPNNIAVRLVGNDLTIMLYSLTAAI